MEESENAFEKRIRKEIDDYWDSYREGIRKFDHLSMHNQASVISAMLKSGISGYILKDAGREELLNAINALSAGETFFSEEIKSTLMESMISGKKKQVDYLHIKLSERETEVLKLIAEEYTQQQIAEKLFISPHTVVFHRRNLFQKFQAKNTAGLIKTAIEKGIL